MYGSEGQKDAAVSKPVITFALFCYNQEKFIREAVRGALAQTYSPLQIIFSDDCSQDRTFDIIREEVDGYEGPHEILLNRNEHNLGIGGHLNRLMGLVEGKLVVAAAGDDISLPTRTGELVKVWSGGGVFSAYSTYTIIDENGTEQGIERGVAAESAKTWQDRVRSGVMRGLGCAHAWDRAIFEAFGPLPDDTVQEDIAIPFRAALLGRVAYIDKPLAMYRRHGANVWKRRDDVLKMDLAQFIEEQISTARSLRLNLESWLRDVRLFSSVRPEMEDELRWASEVIAARISFYSFKEAALRCKRTDRLRGCLRAVGRVRKLGTKTKIKTVLLGAAPMTYCKMHRWRYMRSGHPKST